ncbi:hypothetical protein AUJ46_06680 [Candidatus Peregrinibacteria bacterium CG1_02_54_53]|nr:MAG: hypothetical protein AUJ46_06680 [Candidatus Peregrinibacteria bacterium CG1_02_54_53]
MDIFTKKKRSEIMSKIRGKKTGVEERGWAMLREAGIRFRKHPKGIFGNPDAANKSKKIAIFFDSEFWHGYDWEERRKDIKSNRKFWIKKIERNIVRDREVNAFLKKRGWKVLRIWCHQMNSVNMEKTLGKIRSVYEAQR